MIAYGYAFVPVNLILLGAQRAAFAQYYQHIGLSARRGGGLSYPLIATNGSLPAIDGRFSSSPA